MMPWTDIVAYSGMAVSAISLLSLMRRDRFVSAAIGAALTAVLVFVATYLQFVPLTPTEVALLWFTPALVAFDVAARAVPLSCVILLFIFAFMVHSLLFNPWWPLLVLVGVALVLALPFARNELPLGDRAVIVWLCYAFGLLGLLGSAAALLLSAGRKNVPYAAHAAAASVVFAIPTAAFLAHRGMLLWRF